MIVVFQVDKEEERIRNVLNALGTEGDRALKNAINQTARKVRKDMVKHAAEKYDYEKKESLLEEAKFNSAKKAAFGGTAAVISAKGEATEVGQFDVDDMQVHKGKDKPASIKGKVFSQRGMKELKTKDAKAFVAQFKSGHIAVVVREKLSLGQKIAGYHKGYDYKYATYRLKKLLSPSVPQMLGNKEAMNEIIEPEIQDLLVKNLERQMKMIMKQKTKTGKLID